MEVFCRRARVVCDHISGFNPLSELIAAVDRLNAENRLPAPAAALQRVALFLHTLVAAAKAPPVSIPKLQRLQTMFIAAEDTVAHLRTCHEALTRHANATAPAPLGRQDATLVAARDAATSAFSIEAMEIDVAAVYAVSRAIIAELNTLLGRASKITGIATDWESDTAASNGDSNADLTQTATAAADGVSDGLTTAVSRLNCFEAHVTESAARLKGLDTVILASFGELNTRPVRLALESMHKVTDSLLLDTANTSLSHYLAFGLPWHDACSSIVTRIAALREGANSVTQLVQVASDLNSVERSVERSV